MVVLEGGSLYGSVHGAGPGAVLVEEAALVEEDSLVALEEVVSVEVALACGRYEAS